MPSILTHMLSDLSFLDPCGCYATAVIFVSAIEDELLFFYLSLWFHQSLSICFLLASSLSCSILIHLSCVVIPVLYMILTSKGGVFSFHSMYVIYGCVYWHIYWCTECTHIYDHPSDLLALVLCIFVLEFPVHDV